MKKFPVYGKLQQVLLAILLAATAPSTLAGFFDELDKLKKKATEIKEIAKESAQEIQKANDALKPQKPPTEPPSDKPTENPKHNSTTQKTASQTIKKTSSATTTANTDNKNKSSTNGSYLFVTDQSGGYGGSKGLGQPGILNADKSRVQPNEAIIEARKTLTKVYLHYYPEAITSDENTVLMYAGTFFPEDVRAFHQSRPNAFERRKKIKEFEDRLKQIKTAPPGLMTFYIPVAFSQNYDFDKQSFPLNLQFDYNLPITTGIANWSCIEVDKRVNINELKMNETVAEEFMNRNKSGTGSSTIFIGYTLQITGKPELAANQNRSCTFAATLENIKGYEFHGKEAQRYAVQTASIGPEFRDWTGGNKEATIETAYKFRQVAEASASKEAKQFNLLTKDGLIQYPLTSYSREIPQEAHNALRKYVDFIEIGINPEFFQKQAICYARNYLTKAEAEKYLGKGASWKGDTQFEQEDHHSKFMREVGKQFKANAISGPQKYVLVSRQIIQNYDNKFNGFWTQQLINSIQLQNLQGNCATINIQPSADFIDPIWAMSPNEADKLLNSLNKPESYSSYGQETLQREIYIKAVVSVTPLAKAKPVVKTEFEVPQNPPMLVNIEKLELYADKDLQQPVHSFAIHQPPKPVLATGVPTSPQRQSKFLLHSGNAEYTALLAKAQLDKNSWNNLIINQVNEDNRFYQSFSTQGLQGRDSTTPKILQGYQPFYPKGYNINLDYMSSEHFAMQKEWIQRHAKSLPDKLTLKTILKYGNRNGQESVALELNTTQQLPQFLVDAGLQPDFVFYPPQQDNYGRYKMIGIADKYYQLIFKTPKAVKSYSPTLSVAETFKEEDGWHSYYGSLETDLNFKLQKVELLENPEQGGIHYLVVHIQPTSMEAMHHSNGKVYYQHSY